MIIGTTQSKIQADMQNKSAMAVCSRANFDLTTDQHKMVQAARLLFLLTALAAARTLDCCDDINAASPACCAIVDQQLACWGSNSRGQISLAPRSGPWRSVCLGQDFGCASRSNLTVQCWGTLKAPVLTNADTVSCGQRHACALLITGGVACWGANDAGQRVPPPALGNVTELGLGDYHSCALITSGAITCWGASSFTGVPQSLPSVVAITAGDQHTCAIIRGSLQSVCWGTDDGVGK